MKRTISLLVCIISILCLTACGGGSGTHEENGREPEIPQNESSAEAEPLSESDFVIMMNNETEDRDLLEELQGFEVSGSSLFYYDPEQDESREGVLKTARGISLGDPKDEVLLRYGDGDGGAFDEDTDLAYSVLASNQANDLAGQMSSECNTYVRYYYQDFYVISFYFDENDEVSWIAFSMRE